ncbi:hypothetical protein P171DRAFT_207014 [Karstenula rhodostoma CBS 690.94]|uniref:Uncharacterized protein n=1 Tax=Karstenula rhodostoma CBS 690.94 TaxID=1392251 RepID=A0A9P4PQ80_9PLEO|nr:hypothetical protein P171DRAFT_207014 [Karstenula rhodostoma CBS 690.94]
MSSIRLHDRHKRRYIRRHTRLQQEPMSTTLTLLFELMPSQARRHVPFRHESRRPIHPRLVSLLPLLHFLSNLIPLPCLALPLALLDFSFHPFPLACRRPAPLFFRPFFWPPVPQSLLASLIRIVVLLPYRPHPAREEVLDPAALAVDISVQIVNHDPEQDSAEDGGERDGGRKGSGAHLVSKSQQDQFYRQLQ